jgi:hypothetical protein
LLAIKGDGRRQLIFGRRGGVRRAQVLECRRVAQQPSLRGDSARMNAERAFVAVAREPTTRSFGNAR